MQIRTVMASLALDQSNEACLAVAGDLAGRFGARVIGIAASDVRPPLYFTEGEYAEKLLADERAVIEARLSELETIFRAALVKRAKTLEWRASLQFPTAYIVDEARAADLVICARPTQPNFDSYSFADPNDIVMQAGRPVLVIPPTARHLDLRRVLVAWKNTKEARRAVFDALPLLAQAKDVTVVEIIEEGDRRTNALPSVKDVTSWLDTHGIPAEVIVADREGDVGSQLEDVAADVGATLIVAGAYGHSRFREWIMGGMTRHLMTQSNRCVLLSR
jgi:nucleotide-binding universal stress UspA family protein